MPDYFPRRRARTELQAADPPPAPTLDPARALPGHCGHCGLYVGRAGNLRRHYQEMHQQPTYAKPPEPVPEEPLTPIKVNPNQCPRCHEVQEPRMMLRHTRLCGQPPRET